MSILIWYLSVINFITWVTYGLDKGRAKVRKMAYPGTDASAAGSDRGIPRGTGRNDNVPS